MRAHRLLIVTLVAACGGWTAAPRPPQPAVDAVLGELTPRQKVAQLVVPWLGGNYMALDDSAFQIATRWVDTLEVGGIVISVGSPYDIAAKLNTLQRRSRLPLLVSADLEWGAAMRVVGATAFPYIMAAGATGNERDAYTIGRVAAIEGRAVGIHVNFAPDADVNNNPLNPIINTRSFGEDPKAVARLVRGYVRGLQDNGMLATLKHFPGHGDTDADSHIGLPAIRVDYARLDSVELVPFRAGIDAGAQVVMSAHIAFPALTGETPATLSAAMLTGVLRDSLKFKGLVVTDALQMGAIVAKYGAGKAAVRAFEAGGTAERAPHHRAPRFVRKPRARDQAAAGPLRSADRAARFDRAYRRVQDVPGCRGRHRATVPDPRAGHQRYRGAAAREPQPHGHHCLRRRAEQLCRAAHARADARRRRHGRLLPALDDVGNGVVRFGARRHRARTNRDFRDERAADRRQGQYRTARLARAPHHGDGFGEADRASFARQSLSLESDSDGEVVPDRLERCAARRARRGARTTRLVAGARETADPHPAGVSDRSGTDRF